MQHLQLDQDLFHLQWRHLQWHLFNCHVCLSSRMSSQEDPALFSTTNFVHVLKVIHAYWCLSRTIPELGSKIINHHLILQD